MIEYFGIFAIGIVVGILGTLMILRGLRGEFFTNDDEELDEVEFEELEEIFSDEELDVPEDAEIDLSEVEENANENE